MAEGGLTRIHWMPDSAIKYCTNISCAANLSSRKKYNCRCCGNVFCGNCTKFSLPLDPESAQIDYNGVWAKVCVLCYNRGVDEGVLEGANSVFVSQHSTESDENSVFLVNGSFSEPRFHSRNQSFSHSFMSKDLPHTEIQNTSVVSRTSKHRRHHRSSSCTDFPNFDSPESALDADESQLLAEISNQTTRNESSIPSQSKFGYHGRSYSLMSSLDVVGKRATVQGKFTARPAQTPASEPLVRALKFNGECQEESNMRLENLECEEEGYARQNGHIQLPESHDELTGVDLHVIATINAPPDRPELSKDSSPVSNRYSNFDESFSTDNSNLNSETHREFESDGEIESQPSFNNEVGSWSVHNVCEWMKRNVTFGTDRVEEYIKIFEEECVDGSVLLTLQRTHPACASMQPGDWLALKVARRRLLAELPRASSLPSSIPTRVQPVYTDESDPEDWQWSDEDSDWDEDTTCFSISPNPPALADRSLSFPSEDSSKKSTWFSNLRGKSNSEDAPNSVLTSQNLNVLIGMAEEREAAVRSQLSHLDKMLRVSPMASFLKIRKKWNFEFGNSEPDDYNQSLDQDHLSHHNHSSLLDMEDDWLPRFVVLQPPRIAFYLHAGDSKAEIAIPLHLIIKCDYLHLNTGSGMNKNHFFITSNNGIRIECSTKNHRLTELWVSSIRDCILSQSSFITSYNV